MLNWIDAARGECPSRDCGHSPMGYAKYLHFMNKAIAALAIVGMLCIAIISLPEHISATSSHDGCEICHFFNHPPTLHLDNPSLTNPTDLRGWLSPLPDFAGIRESAQATQPSRAPPSFC